MNERKREPAINEESYLFACGAGYRLSESDTVATASWVSWGRKVCVCVCVAEEGGRGD